MISELGYIIITIIPFHFVLFIFKYMFGKYQQIWAWGSFLFSYFIFSLIFRLVHHYQCLPAVSVIKSGLSSDSFGQELEKNQWHWSNMHTAHFGQYLPPDGKRWWHWWWHASCSSWAVSSPDCLGGPAVPKELVSRTGETRASFESRNTFLPDQCSLSHWLRRERL